MLTQFPDKIDDGKLFYDGVHDDEKTFCPDGVTAFQSAYIKTLTLDAFGVARIA